MLLMRSFVNATLAENVALMIKGKAIGRLRSDMKSAGFDIGQGTLQRIVAGETGVRMESLQKFADYFSVDVDTLLRGRVAEGEDFIQLVRLDVEAAPERSRKTNLVEELGALQFRRDFLRAIGVSPVNAGIVHVTGTSMEPTIRDGAVLLLNRVDRTPRRGSVYAFAWEGQMLVRRFQRVGDVWHAVADNADKSEHPDVVIAGKAEGLVQGRAIWVGAKL